MHIDLVDLVQVSPSPQRNGLEPAYRHACGLAKSATALKVALDVYSRREQSNISTDAAESLRYHIDCALHHISELERVLHFGEGADGDHSGDHRNFDSTL